MTAEREREIDSRLADWVDGTLTGRERERFLAELRVNAQLRKDLAEYERTVATVREALQARTAKVDLADRVMAAIAAEEQAVAEKRAAGPFAIRRITKDAMRSKAVLASLASAAALLVIAIVLSTWTSPPPAELQATHDAPTNPTTTLDDFLKKQEAPISPTAPAGTKPDEAKSVEAAKNAAPPPSPGGQYGSRGSRPAGQDEKEKRAAPRSAPEPAGGEGVAPGAAPKPGSSAGGEPRESVPTPSGAASRAAPPPTETKRRQADAEIERSELQRSESADVSQRPVDVVEQTREGGEPVPGTRTPPPAGPTAGFVPAPERLALVLLQGDAIDGIDRAARSGQGTAGGGRAGLGKDADVAPTVDATLDAFFENQMRLEPVDARTSLEIAAPATLRLRTIAVPPARADRTDAGARLEPVERTWLVEGTKEEVQTVVKRLAAFAKTRHLVLQNGEDAVVVPPAPPPPPATAAGSVPHLEAETADKAAPRTTSLGRDAAPTRLLLRFRLLRR